MKHLLNWLQGNKQWVFSGVGVALLMLILGWLFSGKEPAPTTVSTNGGVAAGGDIRGSQITIATPRRPKPDHAKTKGGRSPESREPL